MQLTISRFSVTRSIKACAHCKSPGQIGGVARPSGLISVYLAGRLVSSTLFKHFFSALTTFSIFSAGIPPSPIVIAGPSNLVLRWVNSQKCFIKIQYRDCDGRREWWKSRPKKIKPMTFLIFLALFSSPGEGLVMIEMRRCDGQGGVCEWLSDKNRDRKNWTYVFDFFGHDFCLPISHINSFENLKFSKLFDEDTISQIRVSCDCCG